MHLLLHMTVVSPLTTHSPFSHVTDVYGGTITEFWSKSASKYCKRWFSAKIDLKTHFWACSKPGTVRVISLLFTQMWCLGLSPSHWISTFCELPTACSAAGSQLSLSRITQSLKVAQLNAANFPNIIYSLGKIEHIKLGRDLSPLINTFRSKCFSKHLENFFRKIYLRKFLLGTILWKGNNLRFKNGLEFNAHLFKSESHLND